MLGWSGHDEDYMKFGLFYQIQVPKPWDEDSESKRIWEALDQIEYAEEMGYDSVWFSEHHFRPVWSHNSAPDLTLAAVSQRTSRIRLGVGVVLAPIHHPLHTAARMSTLDILSNGRVDVGLGRTGYPYQLTPYGTKLEDTRGMWEEFAQVLPKIWTEEVVSHEGKYYQIPPREVLPKPLQKPHPPLWSACSSEATTRTAAELGLGALVGSEGGPDKVGDVLQSYHQALKAANPTGVAPNSQNALMTAGFCHEDPKEIEGRGTELIGWYMDQQRERARLVWQGVDPATVPSDYQGYYERDMKLAAGPHQGEATASETVKKGTSFCVGTPEQCIEFFEKYEAMGVEQVFLLSAIGPASHEEVMNTLTMFGKHVIPHFRAKEKAQAASGMPSAAND
ncbi:MAG: LLM class flavin-dependent oxidoreductase [SAR202 cluster bacterium]|nr:LLM class flavin-dependent oxidoreductase [SAR202 cluster bacterium]MQG64650.1 LLM class flavin-dependent oxidoreductase [SAR202 cluster bacterium]